MQTTITGIIALIKTKLAGLKINDQEIFGAVFDYADGDFKKFPACVVTETGGKGEVMDTHRNVRTHEFEIKLYQEQSRAGSTKKEAADLMRAITDEVLEAFDKDKDLSGEVDIIRVVEFDTNFKVAAGTFNFATFKVEVVVLVLNHN